MLGGGFHRCQAASRWLKGAGSTSCFFTILGPFFFSGHLGNLLGLK